jgi:hypothetical protein
MKRHQPARPRPSRTARLAAALIVCLVTCLTAWIAAPGTAEARTERTTYFSYAQVWPTAIRFLRVDEGHEVVEKDEDAGYVLFEVVEENKRFRGALELVRVKDERGRPAVRMVVRIDDRPAYMELGLLDRLERKLRQEYGEPPAFVPRPAKPAKPDKKAGLGASMPAWFWARDTSA